MNEKIYLRAVGNGSAKDSDFKAQFKSLKHILDADAILSLRSLGRSESRNFTGLDYISLCDYEKRFISHKNREHYNSYYGYIVNSISLGFNKNDLEVIEPTLVDICSESVEGFKRMKELGMMEERYSDLPDEVQAKDKISLDKLSLITFPSYEYLSTKLYFRTSTEIKLLRNKIIELKTLLEDYNRLVPIYDIDNGIELTDENIEKIVLMK